MAKEEEYERLSEDPSVFIDKARIHRQASSDSQISPEQQQRNIERSRQARGGWYTAQPDTQYSNKKEVDREDLARWRAELARSADEFRRERAEEARIKQAEEARNKPPAPQPVSPGSSGTGCLLPVIGIAASIALTFIHSHIPMTVLPIAVVAKVISRYLVSL